MLWHDLGLTEPIFAQSHLFHPYLRVSPHCYVIVGIFDKIYIGRFDDPTSLNNYSWEPIWMA